MFHLYSRHIRILEETISLTFVLQEKVLHNIMPIFTFMGANILRLDDAYSFRVIDKTVQMVIPALIQVSSDPNVVLSFLMFTPSPGQTTEA